MDQQVLFFLSVLKGNKSFAKINLLISHCHILDHMTTQQSQSYIIQVSQLQQHIFPGFVFINILIGCLKSKELRKV